MISFFFAKETAVLIASFLSVIDRHFFLAVMVVKREIMGTTSASFVPQRGEHKVGEDTVISNGQLHRFVTVKTPITTIPFVKTHEFNYARLLPASLEDYTYILYILIVIFIVTAVSNGANITDGLDGLATGVSAIIGVGLGVFVFVSGDLNIAEYLNIMYIPNLSELAIFIAAFVGACVGFLWYNAYPAQVFMGGYRQFNYRRNHCGFRHYDS